MTIEDTEWARFDNRAGYRLVDVGTVGLPLYRLTALAVCLASKKLSPIEEFVLRAGAAGLRLKSEIAGFLGLDEQVIDVTLSELLRQELITSAPTGDSVESSVTLTLRGQEVVRAEELVTPVEQTLVFLVDGLTRRPVFYPQHALFRPRELKDAGIPEIRSVPARPPNLDEIPVTDVAEVLRIDSGRAESPFQLLRLRSIEKRERVFLNADAFAYRAEKGDDVQVGFAIDGRPAVLHEQAFLRANLIEGSSLFRGLSQRVRQPTMEELLGPDLAQIVAAESASAQSSERVPTAEADDVAVKESPGRTTAPAKVTAAAVRPLAVYEHAPLLRRAIAEAERRLLIMSPWIRRAVVSQQFINALSKAGARGVRIHIGYGIGQGDDGQRWDREARDELEDLARRSSGRITVNRLGDTHAKVLIKDSDFFVISSFNWLSFRGDPQRQFREEWGTLVEVPSVVDDYYARMVARFPE